MTISARSATATAEAIGQSRAEENSSELTRPIMRYIDDLDARTVDDFVTVVVPEFTLDKWWHQLLHNQSALVLRTRLRGRPNTIVTSVPFHVDPAPQPKPEPVSAPD